MIAVLLFIAVLFYLYSTKNFSYWQRRGIKHNRPIPVFGTSISSIFMKKSLTQIVADVYWKYPNEKVIGFYRSNRPGLVIRDPEIIKRILITDFYCFHQRGYNTHDEPLFRNVFFGDGDLWRLLRKRMTPAFTSGKLRAMFPLIAERAESLQARALAAAPIALDARDLMARYTTDFIGACGFGLNADSLNDEKSTFRQLGQKIFNVGCRDALVQILKSISPEIFQRLRYVEKVERDMYNLVAHILKDRNYEPSERNDFIDLLLECQKKGMIIGESIEKKKPNGSPEDVKLEMTNELLAAQVFMFFTAGFETSSSATSFTLHQLAFHPEVQRKAQEEVDRVLAKHGNKFTYDAIKEMKYLEWTFKEGMRMFPSLGLLIRKCARKCMIPELGVEIDPGVGVVIPVQALHNDPQYFPEPDEFRPERFHPEQVHPEIHSSRAPSNKYVYLPFGDGPRACIGARLGMMQSVAGLAAVLARCSVSPATTTLRHPQVDPRATVVQNIKGGLPLMFHPRPNM